MTTSLWKRQHYFITNNSSVDIAIVGGGFLGLSVAFWLTEFRPDLKISIIERSLIGSGASGRNAGFLTMGSASFYKKLCQEWGRDKAIAVHQFAATSIELVYKKILKVSPEIKFERSSSMTLFQNEKQLKEWDLSGFNANDFHFQFRDQGSLPNSLKSNFYASWENSPEYKIDPILLLSSLKKILESRNVQFVENNSAFEIVTNGIKTELNTIKADTIVLALNGYFTQFHPTFKQTIIPKRAQMLAVQLEEEFDCPDLYYDTQERVYWRKTQERNLIIGGKRLLDEQGEISDFEKVTPLIQNSLEQYLMNQLKIKFKVLNRWSGTMGFTEHELPFSGKLNSASNTFMVGGFSGHGMGLGFNSGKDLAEVILGQKKDSFFNQFKRPDFSL